MVRCGNLTTLVLLARGRVVAVLALRSRMRVAAVRLVAQEAVHIPPRACGLGMQRDDARRQRRAGGAAPRDMLIAYHAALHITRTAYDFTHSPPKSYYNIDAPSQSHHWPQRLGVAYGCSWIDP